MSHPNSAHPNSVRTNSARTNRAFRAACLVVASALALSACGGSGGGGGGSNGGGQVSEADRKGGTLHFLTLEDQFTDPDPQRNYSGEDQAFFQAYLYRTLTGFKLSPGKDATDLVADLATDTGKETDNGKAWTFTLRDGVKWEDGKPVTCEDLKYGVSRTFATDTITNGPQYAVQMLDIPQAKDGSSTYKGPYDTKASNDTAAFDQAVQCSQNTITFHLNRPVPDFNYTVTMSAFSPVHKDLDTAEKYDDHPMSNGPYKITEYTKGSRMVMVRNDNWDPASDPIRKAYPDQIEVTLGLETSVMDQRLQADAGEDKQAISPDPVEPASLSTVFGNDRFKDRRINDLDVFVSYIAINTKLVPNLKQRQAIAVALDRAQLRTIAGGSFAGDLADGVVKPNLAKDYAPSGMWDTLLGQKIPDGGDPAYAKKLIAESGQPMPNLIFDYNQTPTNDRAAASLVGSLKKAGIKVRPNPIEQGAYYGIVQDPSKEHHLALAGWGPDWPNASTVIPELFTPTGGFNLSQADDGAFNKAVAAAKVEIDRDKQATMWQELNRQAMANAWVIPTRFRREQRLAGSQVHSASGKNGAVYLWAPFGSWPYADLYVTK